MLLACVYGETSLVMKRVKEFLIKKVMPGLLAMLFVTALLLVSIFVERRHIYF